MLTFGVGGIGLRKTITDEGVWRIRRRQGAAEIEVFQVEEVGHGEIVSDEFMNHRIKLEMEMRARQQGGGEGEAEKEAAEPEVQSAAATGA